MHLHNNLEELLETQTSNIPNRKEQTAAKGQTKVKLLIQISLGELATWVLHRLSM